MTEGTDGDSLRIDLLPSLEAGRAEWETLAADAGNIFSTLDWASAWMATLGDESSAQIALCRRQDGSVAAILPLVVRQEHRLRVVRLLGHGSADCLAPLCSPADRPRVALAMRRFLDQGECDLFIGEEMPADEGWAEALGATTLKREASPVLWIGGIEWEEFLAGRSSNFRQQVRRREKRLAKQGDLRFRLTEDPAELSPDLETLFALHDARWRATEIDSAFTGRARELHRKFAPAALERGWLRLWLLELDGRPLAAWYGFRFGGAEWFYQSGRDPEAESDAVGFVLFCHTIREAMNDGMREYRLLRGDEAYKSRFANRDSELETAAIGLTPRGRARLLDLRARPAVGRALRRLRVLR